MTISAEAYRSLLERCIRLEAKLLGIVVPPQPTPDLYTEPPAQLRLPAHLGHPRRQQKRATAADIEAMRALRRQGMSHAEIGRRTGFSASTAGVHTRDIRRQT